MQVQLAVPVEVGVHLEKAALPDLVHAATFQIGIRDQACNSADAFQELQKGRGVETLNQAPRGGAKLPGLRCAVLSERAIPVALDGHPIGLNFGNDAMQNFRWEQTVQDDVRKRIGIAVGRRPVADFGVV